MAHKTRDERTRKYIDDLLKRPESGQEAGPYEAYIDSCAKDVAKTPEGRAFIMSLLMKSGLMSQSFKPDLGEEVTAFNEGRRSIGIALHRDIQRMGPTIFIQMQQEYVQFQMNLETKGDKE